jgi:methylmalonyl-CoA carboxyltransferase small subunit
MLLKVTVDGVVYEVEVEVEDDPRPPLGTIFMGGGFVPQHAAAPVAPTAASGEGVKAPLGGTVVRIPVKQGQEIAEGDVVVVLEAMKMETEITAAASGTVAEVLVDVGDAVTGGQVLLRVDAD